MGICRHFRNGAWLQPGCVNWKSLFNDKRIHFKEKVNPSSTPLTWCFYLRSSIKDWRIHFNRNDDLFTTLRSCTIVDHRFNTNAYTIVDHRFNTNAYTPTCYQSATIIYLRLKTSAYTLTVDEFRHHSLQGDWIVDHHSKDERTHCKGRWNLPTLWQVAQF